MAGVDGPTRAGAPQKLSGYTEAIVEPVSVEKGAATKNFPGGLDLAIQDRTVAELREKKLFREVRSLEQPAVPGSNRTADPGPSADRTATQPTTGSTSEAGGPAAAAGKSLVVSMDVISFDKGSTAKRFFVGMGAGRSKTTVRFILRDNKSGGELMRFEQTATWNGMTSFTGGDADDAARGVTNNIVKGLIGEIAKNL